MGDVVEIKDRNATLVEMDAAQKASLVQRVIAAMPVVVSYEAEIATVRQLQGSWEASFEWAVWEKTSDGRPSRRWKSERLDPFAVRAEFLAVKTERNALDFLRHNGSFHPLQDSISWSAFRRWQDLVRIIQDREGLIETQLHPASPKSADHVEVLKMFADYPHEFFGGWSLLTKDQLADFDDETRAAITEGERAKLRAMRKLEQWFVRPPTEIFWFPRMVTGLQRERLQRAGVVPEFLAHKQELVPHLLITTRTALTAIAATLYADRVGDVTSKICPQCKKRFELEGPHDKRKCCTSTCTATAKKARQRMAKKNREAHDGKA